MGQALAIRHCTPQEYYQLERAAPFKSEYINGEIVAMAGSSSADSLISTNLLGELYARLKGKPCTAYNSDQRLRVKETGMRAYPDATVYCGKLEYDPEDDQSETATNPTAVFEVLSDSTEGYDRGAKGSHYRRIESLKAYVLVSQRSPSIEMFHIVEGRGWQFTEVSVLNASLHIPCLGIDLSLAEIYDGVTLDREGQSIRPLQAGVTHRDPQ